MEPNKYLTIEAITKYIKFKFDSDINLKTVYLKGEISNFKSHSTGHYYFSLKDEVSKINAIMFSNNNKKLVFKPTDGMKVLVTGRISVYESTGNYQIYVEEMLEDGLGNLYIAFEQLKQKLEKEGLFSEVHKKKIPKYPESIGIVTAETGAAIKDIITTIKRRYPICNIFIFPTLVQGENASIDIANNIKRANNYPLDILIVGRGGGSIEDLWPFNEEIVAREIFNSKIPVISGIGHEIDFTISDFVADLRAPTPTAAAELAVPNIVDLKYYLKQLNIRLNETINQKINYKNLYLDSIKSSFVIKNPMIIYENKKQKLDNILEQINKIIKYKIEKERIILNNLKHTNILINPINLYKSKQNEFLNLINKLELLNPLNILKRGYTLTYYKDKIINDLTNIKKDDIITTKFSTGTLKSVIIEKEIKNGKENEI